MKQPNRVALMIGIAIFVIALVLRLMGFPRPILMLLHLLSLEALIVAIVVGKRPRPGG